jgi:hypothetical protein
MRRLRAVRAHAELLNFAAGGAVRTLPEMLAYERNGNDRGQNGGRLPASREAPASGRVHLQLHPL